MRTKSPDPARRAWARSPIRPAGIIAAFFAALALCLVLRAQAPDWWAERNVFKAGAVADDYSVANLGQLKHMATQAAAEMDAKLANGGAGEAIHNLLNSWAASNDQRDDYAALTVGQLKAVASKFHERLAAVQGRSVTYPWGGAGLPPADDYALANVGQVKAVFAFAVPVTGGGTGTGGTGTGGTGAGGTGQWSLARSQVSVDMTLTADRAATPSPDSSYWSTGPSAEGLAYYNYPQIYAEMGDLTQVTAQVRRTSWEVWTDGSGAIQIRNFSSGLAAGVTVDLRVITGDGTLVGGGRQLTAITNADGVATCSFVMGEQNSALSAEASSQGASASSGFYFSGGGSAADDIMSHTTFSPRLNLWQTNDGVAARVLNFGTTEFEFWNPAQGRMESSEEVWCAGPAVGAMVTFTARNQEASCASGVTGSNGVYTASMPVTGPTTVDAIAEFQGVTVAGSITIDPATPGAPEPGAPDPGEGNPPDDEPENKIFTLDSKNSPLTEGQLITVSLSAGPPRPDGTNITLRSTISAFWVGVNWSGEFKGQLSLEKGDPATLKFDKTELDLTEGHDETELRGITMDQIAQGIRVKLEFSDPFQGHVTADLGSALPVEFRAREGRINLGFDPPLADGNPADPPWASVIRGQSNDNVVFAAPADFAPSVKLSVTDGFDYLNVAPKETPLSGAETMLTLFGLDENYNVLTNTTAEALKVDGGGSLSTLNVMVLPQRTLHFTVFRITDPNNRDETSPGAVPSDSDYQSTLNEVFKQAGIQWACNGSKAVDCDCFGEEGYYDNNKFFRLLQEANWSPNGGWGKGFKILVFRKFSPGQPAQSTTEQPIPVAAYIALNYSIPTLVAAHEFGHILGLAAKSTNAGDPRHDYPPWPSGTESLMRPGPGTIGTMVNPGKWLRHEDWDKANKRAQALEGM